MPRPGRLAEFTLHVTNFIYFCGGVAILTVGAIGLANPAAVINILAYVPVIYELSYVMYMPGISLGPSIYLTVVGSLVIILSFMGCGGTWRKSDHIIKAFGISTLLIMLFDIALIMFYVIDPYYIQPSVEYNMNKTLTQYFEPVTFSGNTIQYANESNLNAYYWETMQFQQQCCGVQGPSDYLYFNWSNTNYASLGVPVAVVPPSCCMQITPNQTAEPTSISTFINLTQCMNTGNQYANTMGCNQYVMQEVTRYNWIFCVCAAGLTGLQAIILCMTMWLLVLHMGERGLGN